MSIPELLIREIRARPVVAPLPRPMRTASGDVLDAPLLLIDVLTDVGVTGRAYAFAYMALNQSQSTAGAFERIRRLQDFDLTWVEEPVAAEDLVGHRAVRE